MNEEELEKYIKAGSIACRIKKDLEHIVRPGIRLLDLAQLIEDRIREHGAHPAFPVNISINEVAAHYTPIPMDTAVLGEDAVVKIDIGVHVDGYIADTSITIAFNDRYLRLVEVCREALDKALQKVAVGVKFTEVGEVIEKVFRDNGYKPIYNLSGHSMDRYQIHAGDIIPNHRDLKVFGRFKDGHAYAVEPFGTDGVGYVMDSHVVTIYALRYNPKRIRNLSSKARQVFETIYTERKTLPFALRWYTNMYSYDVLHDVIEELRRNGLLIQYPVLVERSHGVVVQFEDTVVLFKGSIYVTTRMC